MRGTEWALPPSICQSLVSRWCRCVLLLRQSVDHFLWQILQQLKKNSVRPPEANHIGLISGADLRVRRAGHNIVLFPDGSFSLEVLRHVRKKLERNAIRLVIKAVAAQSFRGQ